MSQGHRFLNIKFLSVFLFVTFITTPVQALQITLDVGGLGLTILDGSLKDTASAPGIINFSETIGDVDYSGLLVTKILSPSMVSLTLTDFLLVNNSPTFKRVNLDFYDILNPPGLTPLTFQAHLDGSYFDHLLDNTNITTPPLLRAQIAYLPFYQSPPVLPAPEVLMPFPRTQVLFDSSGTSFFSANATTTPGIFQTNYKFGAHMNFALGPGDSFSLPTSASVSASPAPAPVPEPATFILLASGLVGLVFFRRKIQTSA